MKPISLIVIVLSLMAFQSHSNDAPALQPSPGTSMSGPSRAGLFVYAKDLERLSSFYQSVLGMARVHSTADLVVLHSKDMQITVNAIPAQIAQGIEISSPPARRDTAAYKFFFTVDSLSKAKETVASLGGEIIPVQYRGPGFVVHNVIDPEGNIFQLRESAP